MYTQLHYLMVAVLTSCTQAELPQDSMYSSVLSTRHLTNVGVFFQILCIQNNNICSCILYMYIFVHKLVQLT